MKEDTTKSNANQWQAPSDQEITIDRERRQQQLTLSSLAPLQAIENIQATPIQESAAIVSKSISNVMTGHKINDKEKEEWQHKCKEELLNISIFIDEQDIIHHTLDLPMRKIIHAFSMMCFNEQENRQDKTAHGLLTAYSTNKGYIKEAEAETLPGIEKKTDFRCLDLYRLSTTKPKLTTQIIKAFRPEWEQVEGFETLNDEQRRKLFDFFNQGLHLIKFTMSELMADYLGVSKGRNYKDYQKAFSDIINVFYSAYDKTTGQYIPYRLIENIKPFIDGHNKVYYLNLSPLFWKGIVKQWRMYPPIEIDRQIVSQADEPTMILYEYIIKQMRTNWSGAITFGELTQMLLPDDVEKGLQLIRIKEKLFNAFQVLVDNKLLLSNPVAQLMKSRERADTLNQMKLHIETNKEIFNRQ